MMGDLLHDIPGWSITDNGDGHARVAVAAEPNVAIYPSFAELDASAPRSPGFSFRLVEQPAAEVA